MKESEKAYIAGFLDGDGSIMLQFKLRKKVSFGYRAKTTICFYQDKRNQKGIRWIQKKLKAGYLSFRQDNMAELRIEGYTQVKQILLFLKPYIVFKKKQTELILKAIEILQHKPSPKKFLQACKYSDGMSKLNYATTKKKHTYASIRKDFIKRGLIPL